MSDKRKFSIFKRTLVGLCLVTPVVLLVLFTLGFKFGEEFSPDDFTRRTFSYNRLPLIKWTIIKKLYEPSTTPFEVDLIADGWITAVNAQPKKWHLISDAGSQLPQDCDARFLTGYLDLADADGHSFWARWNDQNPLVAKIFWPKIAQMARESRYLEIPDLMRIAMSLENDDVQTFESRLVKDSP